MGMDIAMPDNVVLELVGESTEFDDDVFFEELMGLVERAILQGRLLISLKQAGLSLVSLDTSIEPYKQVADFLEQNPLKQQKFEAEGEEGLYRIALPFTDEMVEELQKFAPELDLHPEELDEVIAAFLRLFHAFVGFEVDNEEMGYQAAIRGLKEDLEDFHEQGWTMSGMAGVVDTPATMDSTVVWADDVGRPKENPIFCVFD
ncbi:MAG: hypothetical protein IAF58_05525 [Leptolyngbya sp.]|nr:hypothetical protein [Candidatus Melainabacteria bacterium]